MAKEDAIAKHQLIASRAHSGYPPPWLLTREHTPSSSLLGRFPPWAHYVNYPQPADCARWHRALSKLQRSLRNVVWQQSIQADWKKSGVLPWLVWLSGLSAGLQTKRSLVGFPVRTHTWVVSQVPSWGHSKGNRSMYLLHINVSLPLTFSLPSPVS